MDTDKSDVADQGHRYSVEEAEVLSEFTKRQVSKWRRRLQEPEKYRAMLYGAAYREAMAEKTDQRGASGTGENEWDKHPQSTPPVSGFDVGAGRELRAPACSGHFIRHGQPKTDTEISVSERFMKKSDSGVVFNTRRSALIKSTRP